MAYCPLAQAGNLGNDILNNSVIKNIAKKHNATSSQIALAFIMSFDKRVPIPKSSSEKHILENINSQNIILDKELPSSTNNEDLFTIFEKEFGRTISPTEYEKINSWLNEDIDKTLIVEALKEAVYNSTTSLRYIETILYSWKKKGIKTKEDVNKERIRYKKSKNEVIEVPDFDWVNNE